MNQQKSFFSLLSAIWLPILHMILVTGGNSYLLQGVNLWFTASFP